MATSAFARDDDKPSCARFRIRVDTDPTSADRGHWVTANPRAIKAADICTPDDVKCMAPGLIPLANPGRWLLRKFFDARA
jgi:hypothetical protein